MMRKVWILLCLGAVMALAYAGAPVAGAPIESEAVCVDGFAGEYPCANVDLVARVPLEAMGGTVPVEACVAGGQVDACGADLWGWTSPMTGREFALVGLRDGTSFVEVTDPAQPVYIGRLPSAVALMSDYRDLKVYADHAFIVGDTHAGQGMQVFDLSRLEAADPADYPITFSADAFYNEEGLEYGHNIWINPASGYAYISRSASCGGAQHIVNIQDPLSPTFAGCLDSGTNDSDAECINYAGPDPDYIGREICAIGSDEWVTFADVTDKANMVILATVAYPGVSRAHQGAFTQGRDYWLVSDTMDEAMLGHNTRIHLINTLDLDNITYAGYYEFDNTARDHNVYVNGRYSFHTNWRSGLRVVEIGDNPGDVAGWEEVAYFDTYPADDAIPGKSGAWSHYDYFNSGVIAVSDVERGLFLLRVNLPTGDAVMFAPAGSGMTREGMTYDSGDVLRYDVNLDRTFQLMDGARVATGDAPIDAVGRLPANNIALSFATTVMLPGIGQPVTPSDVVKFRPAYGDFFLMLDGSDVDLEAAGEDVVGISETPSGRLAVITSGAYDVAGLSGTAGDILRLDQAHFGWNTWGNWRLHYTNATALDGLSLISDSEAFVSVAGTGDDALIQRCDAGGFCTVYWDPTTAGFAGVAAFEVDTP